MVPPASDGSSSCGECAVHAAVGAVRCVCGAIVGAAPAADRLSAALRLLADGARRVGSNGA